MRAQLIAISCSLIVSTDLHAQTCRALSVPSDPDGHVLWRINPNTTTIPELTTDSILVAAAQAANTWNDNTNGMTFQYAGTTTRTSLPSSALDCTNLGINYNLITIEGCSTTAGFAESTLAVASRACLSGNSARQYHIRVFGAGGSACSDRTYVSGINTSGVDIVGLLTHEFGHTLGLDHSGVPCTSDSDCISPNQCDGNPGRCGGNQSLVSVMSPIVFGARGRDVYSYDIKCAAEIDTPRERTARAKTITSGVWSSEFNPDFDLVPSADVAWGFTALGGGSKPAVSSVRADCLAWRKDLLSADPVTCTGADSLVGIGPSNVRWTDFSPDDRVVYSTTSQVNNTGLDASSSDNMISKHRVRYSRSSNGFASSASGNLSACTTMSSFMTCSASEPIFSGEATTSALLAGNFGAGFEGGVTIFAWTNQERDSLFNQDQMVKVAVGMVGTTLLPLPTDLGVRSVVAPGVACNPNATFDCILAYVDPADVTAQVRIKRFNVTTESLRFGISVESGFHELGVNIGTAAKIAVLFNNRSGTENDRFWVVIRALRNNEPLEAYSSLNGSVWTQDTTFTGVSNVGPSSSGNSTAATTGVIYAR